jgi:hypothetical protein
MLDIFKDKKSLIFINSNKEFLSMITGDDFISLEDFEIVSEDELITYQSETTMGPIGWESLPIGWESFKANSENFDLLVEVSFEKLNYKDIISIKRYTSSTKKMTKLRIMTFELVELKSNTKRSEKIQTMLIKPKQILERELESETYNLQAFITEFKRVNKLNDLGI